jgi:hypothetical protein
MTVDFLNKRQLVSNEQLLVLASTSSYEKTQNNPSPTLLIGQFKMRTSKFWLIGKYKVVHFAQTLEKYSN